jgi:hypothetical protein
MSMEMPELSLGSPSTPGAKALAPGEIATSRRCLGTREFLAKLLRRGDRHVGAPVGGPTDGPDVEDSDRLIRDFLADPTDVLRDGCYAMTATVKFARGNYAESPKLGDGEVGGPDYYLCEQRRNAGVRLYENHSVYKGTRNISLVLATEEGAPKVCFLPWRDSRLTYCKLGSDTHLVLTGPLTGCSVFVADVAGHGEENGTYLFHVNTNASGLKGSAAAEAQRRKFDAAVEYLWPGASELTHSLTSVDYRSTTDGTDPEGIAYGVRSESGDWEFFYYVIDVAYATATTVKRAGTPARMPSR